MLRNSEEVRSAGKWFPEIKGQVRNHAAEQTAQEAIVLQIALGASPAMPGAAQGRSDVWLCFP